MLKAGETPLAAALKGARQIGFTVISLTVSLIAVFIPLLLMGGVVGRLFREFAITLSMAVIISGMLSLTLTPMMCAQFLRQDPPGHRPNALFRWSERAFDATCEAYMRSLDWVLRHRIRHADLHGSDAGGDDLAVCGDSQRVPAAAGHRLAGRRHRCGAGHLVRDDGGAAACAGRRDGARS